jgi:hypothetical protein
MIGFIASLLQLQPIITAHKRWLSKTGSIPYWTTSVFSSTVTDWLGSDLRISYFFIFRCPLVNTPQLYTELLNCLLNSLTTDWLTESTLESKSQSKSQLRLTVSQSVSLGVEPRYVWQLRSCYCGAPSLTRGRVYLLHMLLTLASEVILRSESLGTRNHILLSQIWDFSFRRLPLSQFRANRIEITTSNNSSTIRCLSIATKRVLISQQSCIRCRIYAL